MINNSLLLPPIPPPPPDAPSLGLRAGHRGPITQGMGDTDLLCGTCLSVVAQSIDASRLFNLILRCSRCETHNSVVSVSRLEGFVVGLVAVEVSPEQRISLQQCVETAVMDHGPAGKLAVTLQALDPGFTWLTRMLVMSPPEEMYGFVSFISAFLTWRQAHGGHDGVGASAIIDGFFHREIQALEHGINPGAFRAPSPSRLHESPDFISGLWC